MIKVDVLKMSKQTVLEVEVDGPEVREWTVLMNENKRSKSAKVNSPKISKSENRRS